MTQEVRPNTLLEGELVTTIGEALENSRIEGEKIKKALLALYGVKKPPTRRVFHESGCEQAFIFKIGGVGVTHKRTYFITDSGIFTVDSSFNTANTAHDGPKRDIDPIDCVRLAPQIVDKINEASQER